MIDEILWDSQVFRISRIVRQHDRVTPLRRSTAPFKKKNSNVPMIALPAVTTPANRCNGWPAWCYCSDSDGVSATARRGRMGNRRDDEADREGEPARKRNGDTRPKKKAGVSPRWLSLSVRDAAAAEPRRSIAGNRRDGSANCREWRLHSRFASCCCHEQEVRYGYWMVEGEANPSDFF